MLVLGPAPVAVASAHLDWRLVLQS
jgi:hypothetical protein